MLTTPDIAKRQEKRIEEGDELATRQRAGASVHLELGENTLLTAGTASRRGTRLSSMPILSGTLSPSIDLKKRQIGRAALQPRRAFEQPDRTALGQALRSPPEPFVLTQQCHVPAARDLRQAEPPSRTGPGCLYRPCRAVHAGRGRRSRRRQLALSR